MANLPVPTPSEDPAAQFASFIEVQRQELSLKQYEAETRRQQDERAFGHAGRVLDAQKGDRNEQRNLDRHNSKLGFGLLALWSVVAAFLIWKMVDSNHTAELVQIASYLLVSGSSAGVGYTVGKKKTASEPNAPPPAS